MNNFYLCVTINSGSMGSKDDYKIIHENALSKLEVHSFMEIYKLGKKLSEKDLLKLKKNKNE